MPEVELTLTLEEFAKRCLKPAAERLAVLYRYEHSEEYKRELRNFRRRIRRAEKKAADA